jgi:hypothetical protein
MPGRLHERDDARHIPTVRRGEDRLDDQHPLAPRHALAHMRHNRISHSLAAAFYLIHNGLIPDSPWPYYNSYLFS